MDMGIAPVVIGIAPNHGYESALHRIMDMSIAPAVIGIAPTPLETKRRMKIK